MHLFSPLITTPPHHPLVFVYGLVLPDFTRADSLDHHEDLTSAIARRADTMAGAGGKNKFEGRK